MDINKLVVFNKEGHSLNLAWDNISKRYKAKLFFDKNSSDTYKTQAVYLMEKVDPISAGLTVDYDLIQLYNSDGYNLIPGGKTLEITNITKTNNSATFSTKWIYAQGIDNIIPIGSYVSFSGLSGDFASYSSGEAVLFAVIANKQGAIMIRTATNNASAIPSFTFNENTTITSHNIISWRTETHGVTKSYQSITSVYTGRKLTLKGTSLNDGVYTLADVALQKTIKTKAISTTFVANDNLVIDVSLLTDRIPVFEGTVQFVAATNKLVLQVKVPPTVVVGDIIVAEETGIVLNSSNKQNLTVTAINKLEGTITVTASGSLVDQTAVCRLMQTTNKFRIQSEAILASDGTYKTAATYNNLINLYAQRLNNFGIKMRISDSNTLIFESLFNESDYFDITAFKINNVTTTSLSVTSAADDVFMQTVNETLIAETSNLPDEIEQEYLINFEFIDSTGIQLIINGILYGVDGDITIQDTINDFITTHETALNNAGIAITSPVSNKLKIARYYDLPDYQLNVTAKFGASTVYNFEHTNIDFSFIVDKLQVIINDNIYEIAYTSNITDTLESWIDAYADQLNREGIIATSSGTILYLNTIQTNTRLDVIVNTGTAEVYNGDTFTITKNIALRQFASLQSLELISDGSINLETLGFSTGQHVTITGNNVATLDGYYNILLVDADKLGLSYEGPKLTSSTETVNIVTDNYLRKPRSGPTGTAETSILVRWTDDDVRSDIFLYDPIGTQLQFLPNNLTYTGTLPLYNTTERIRLNNYPNADITKRNDPTYQQTIFNTLVFNMLHSDSQTDTSTMPDAMQVFFGFRNEDEGSFFREAEICLTDDVTLNIATDVSNGDDKILFNENGTIELVDTTINLISSGFEVGMLVRFTGVDNTNDGTPGIIFENNGLTGRILSISSTKMVLDITPKQESSLKVVQKPTYPYADSSGTPFTVNRALTITIETIPNPILSITLYAETEIEDERFKVRLRNVGKDLSIQDLHILKDYDDIETGTDWIVMNRKRKEMIELYPEIYDYQSTYRSIDTSLKYWGYGDLELTEYYVNVNPDSVRFGKRFSSDLIGVFDPTVKGWKNQSFVDLTLPNENYSKTNAFSLTYNLTDNAGNYLDDINYTTLQKKLFKLKNWLQKNSAGTAKLEDISGRIKVGNTTRILHGSRINKVLKSSGVHSAIMFNATGYTVPINPSSGNYIISLTFSSKATQDYFGVRIRTFNLDMWTSEKLFLVNSTVFASGFVWICKINNFNIDPSSNLNTGHWEITDTWNLNPVQIIEEQKFDMTDLTFTINSEIDPHFIVETFNYNGYGGASVVKKTYSLDYGQWP